MWSRRSTPPCSGPRPTTFRHTRRRQRNLNQNTLTDTLVREPQTVVLCSMCMCVCVYQMAGHGRPSPRPTAAAAVRQPAWLQCCMGDDRAPPTHMEGGSGAVWRESKEGPAGWPAGCFGWFVSMTNGLWVLLFQPFFVCTYFVSRLFDRPTERTTPPYITRVRVRICVCCCGWLLFYDCTLSASTDRQMDRQTDRQTDKEDTRDTGNILCSFEGWMDGWIHSWVGC